MGAKTRILGIDPGTRLVGYAIIERQARGQYHYLECGVLKADTKTSVQDRLHVIAQHLGDLIEEFSPCVLALEKAFCGRNASSALKLGQARGAIMLLASQRALPTVEYAPSQIKQVVYGNGHATKAQIQDRVQMLFDLHRPPSCDAADALAIALCHAMTPSL